MSKYPTTRGTVALCALLLFAATVHAGSQAAADDRPWRARVAAEVARPAAPTLPRNRFLLEPAIDAVLLSPDGRRIAWRHDDGRRREVWQRDLASGRSTRLLADARSGALAWTRDSRWLVVQTADAVYALAAEEQAGSRLLARLGDGAQRELLAVDPHDPAALLLLEWEGRSARHATRWRLLRLGLDGRREVLHEDALRITDAVLDAAGRLAWLQRLDGVDRVVDQVQAGGRLRERLRCPPLQRCRLLASTEDGGLWLGSDLGRDRAGLLRLDRDGDLRCVHEDPAGVADIDRVVLDPLSRQPRFLQYRSQVAASFALGAADQAHLATIAAALPGRALDLQPAGTAAGDWLVAESGPALQARRWHRYDPRTRTLALLFDAAPYDPRSGAAQPSLPAEVAATAIALDWPGADGLRLHGFLWLPPGRDPARLPLVVNVHGGPWNHFPAAYRNLPQFLANRGYAVFEPNFRGSTGHGRRYLQAAGGDYGNGRVQADIVDGTRWLLAQGIGDAQRVGITGASFGGYATLLGLSFQPELFKVGVAMVPPPDFAWTLRWILRNPAALDISGLVPMEAWLRSLGLDPADAVHMQQLQAESPLANAGRMARPLLLVAGGRDQRVGLPGVVEYAARLAAAGKDVSLLVDAEAGHAGGGALAREVGLYALEAMLHAHLGGDAPVAPDPAMRDYLQQNLRLRGSGSAPWSAATGSTTTAGR